MRNRFSRLRRDEATSPHDVLDRDVAAIAVANEFQAPWRFRRPPPQTPSTRRATTPVGFDHDPPRFANLAPHHPVEQLGRAVAGRFGVERTRSISGGSARSQNTWSLSTPTTPTSAGTRSPASVQASNTSRPRSSSQANKPDRRRQFADPSRQEFLFPFPHRDPARASAGDRCAAVTPRSDKIVVERHARGAATSHGLRCRRNAKFG